ncbi:hypothetical protein KO495_10085 [Colwellia sp. D2M02]|uniref:hypothetical protein n=1 Tax=Colwellia sp. D2M02 TaxID=2841562 RepID=UPI001C0993D4|nr:hypothetical protein [Colwellia sp. D2M02]MBU2893668.1 hypothetical protein [Colwellia sp. D2M02]
MSYLKVLKDVRGKKLPRIVTDSSYDKYSQFCFLVENSLISAVCSTPLSTGIPEYLDSSLTEIGKLSLEQKKLPKTLLASLPEGAGGFNWNLNDRLSVLNTTVGIVAILVTVVATFYIS